MFTASLQRYITLLAALRDGPLTRPTLLARLGDVYPQTASARVMLDRDVRALAQLGIQIEISSRRPPVYSLHGGTPIFDTSALELLAQIRDSYGEWHPQAAQVRLLLAQLTRQFTPTELAIYQQHQVQRVPLDPAIDYRPYAEMFTRLNVAIIHRHVLSFQYQPLNKPTPTVHARTEPYAIEFRDRHFYLVAYTSASNQILDFRLDRIIAASVKLVARRPPQSERRRRTIVFRYRLAAILAQGEISQRFDTQRIVEHCPNGDVIIEAEGRSDFFIIQTLLRYRANAELLQPPELRALMAREVAQLAELYR